MTLILPQRGRLSGGGASLTVSLHSSDTDGGNDNPTLPSFSAGDLLVVFRTETKNTGADPPSASTPSGWTELADDSTGSFNSTGIRVRLLAKIAGAGEDTTPDFRGGSPLCETQVSLVFRGSSPLTGWTSRTPDADATRSGSAGPITCAASLAGPTVQVVGYSTADSSFTRVGAGSTGEIGPAEDSAFNGDLYSYCKYWINDGTASSFSASLSGGSSTSGVAAITLELY